MKIIIWLCVLFASHAAYADELTPVRTYFQKAEALLEIYVKPMAEGYDSNILDEIVDESAILRSGELEGKSLDIYLIARKNKIDSSASCNFALMEVHLGSLKKSLTELLKCKPTGCADQSPDMIRHRYQHYYDDMTELISDCKATYGL